MMQRRQVGGRRRHAAAVVALAGLLCLAAAGCIKLSQEYPQKTSYALDVLRPGLARTDEAPAVLKVRKFRSMPRFEGRGLVSRTGEHQYDADYYHEWFVPPGTMVTQQVVNWMASSGLFAHVLATSSVVEETYLLEGTVTGLYGDYREAGAPKAVVGIEFVLIDARDEAGGVLFQRNYERVRPVGGRSPDLLVQAWNDDLQEILAAMESDLAEVLRKIDARRAAPSSEPARPGR